MKITITASGYADVLKHADNAALDDLTIHRMSKGKLFGTVRLAQRKQAMEVDPGCPEKAVYIQMSPTEFLHWIRASRAAWYVTQDVRDHNRVYNNMGRRHRRRQA